MRDYAFRADEQTIEALRRLRRGWSGYEAVEDAFVVDLTDGGRVVVRVESAAMEPGLEASRLAATVEASPAHAGRRPTSAAGSFAAGSNDVVVFRSETWVEAAGASTGDGAEAGRTVQFSGSPLHRSPTAVAVCAVDDAFVVASGAGEGLLVRCGLRPGTVEVVTGTAEIARFLAERQYR